MSYLDFEIEVEAGTDGSYPVEVTGPRPARHTGYCAFPTTRASSRTSCARSSWRSCARGHAAGGWYRPN